jgi:hypothetical protein
VTFGSYAIDLDISSGLGSLAMLLVLGWLAFQVYGPLRSGMALSLLLLCVRTLALLLCLLLFATPRLSITANGVRQPLIAILLDNSESMQILAGETPRFDQATRLLVSSTFRNLSHRARVQTYRFSESLVDEVPSDSALWNGPATDVATSLTQLSTRVRGEGLAGVFLISDGANNIGENPGQAAEDLGAPIYTIPIGVEDPPHDVALGSLTVPSLAYVGRKIEITATVSSVGIDRTPHSVRVYNGDRKVGETPILIDGGDQEIRVSITPTTPGLHAIRVVVPVLEGEVEHQNNQEIVEIEVLAARANVLVVGNPSADLAFVLRMLRADSNLTVDAVVSQGTDGIPFGLRARLSDIADQELVILHDVPGSLMSTEIEASLRRHVESGHSLLAVGGEGSMVPDWGGRVESDLMPIASAPPHNGYLPSLIPFKLVEQSSHHPILKSDGGTSTGEAWTLLPPYTGLNPGKLRDGGGAISLIEVTESGFPILATSLAGEGKVAVLAARGFARQALMMEGLGEGDRVVRLFWSQLVRWLLTREDVAKLRVTTEKSTYRSGEPITFRAEVYDDLLQPVDDADVYLEVDGEMERTAVLLRKGNGVYSGVFRGLQQGTYPYRVRAAWDGDTPAETTGSLTVGRYSVEFEDLLADPATLESIARRSGGHVIQASALAAFVDSLKLSPQPHAALHQFRLWGDTWPLVFLIAAFSFEWYTRRSRGMV